MDFIDPEEGRTKQGRGRSLFQHPLNFWRMEFCGMKIDMGTREGGKIHSG
jgi:hypothetical protein